MDKSFLEYMKEFLFLSIEDLKLIYGIVKIKNIEMGEQVIKPGDLNYHGIVVLKGLLRTYTVTSEGVERTLLLSAEKMKTGSKACILEDKPAIETIEAIETSKLLLIDTRKFQTLAKKYPRLLLLENKGLKEIIVEAAERIRFFTVLTAEERYIAFRDNYPNLIQRVPQKYLASYIGITTVSLSRIKSRVAQKKK